MIKVSTYFCIVFCYSVFGCLLSSQFEFEFSKILKLLLSAKKSEESFFQAIISEKIIEKFVPSGKNMLLWWRLSLLGFHFSPKSLITAFNLSSP